MRYLAELKSKVRKEKELKKYEPLSPMRRSLIR